MADRLTSLAAVKDWLALETDSSDTELTRLIEAGSAYAYGFMNRGSFAAHQVVETSRGNGKDTMLLREWPVISISALGIEGVEVPPATVGNFGLASNGYQISDFSQPNSPQSINLFGKCFWYRSQVQVVYRAGYETEEDHVIETVTADSIETVVGITPGAAGFWLVDEGVEIDGTAATKVSSDPATGEYSVSEWGEYIFSIDDKDKVASITFGYVPWDISQAVCELVGETFRYKQRIGVKSKSLAGQETVSYFDSVMTPTVSGVLNLYQNVVPM